MIAIHESSHELEQRNPRKCQISGITSHFFNFEIFKIEKLRNYPRNLAFAWISLLELVGGFMYCNHLTRKATHSSSIPRAKPLMLPRFSGSSLRGCSVLVSVYCTAARIPGRGFDVAFFAPQGRLDLVTVYVIDYWAFTDYVIESCPRHWIYNILPFLTILAVSWKSSILFW